MTPIWLTDFTLNGIKVEKAEIPRPGNKPYYPMDPKPTGVLHTTESNTIQSAMAQLRMRFDAPHFVVGEGRILQCRPIGVQAAALHDPGNRTAFIQIEQVGFSKQQLWQLPDSTLQSSIAIMAYAAEQDFIPLQVPFKWPDDVADMHGTIWAANNKRRQRASQADGWGVEPGWWMHMEVPNQGPTWHWDCGAVKRSELISQAQAIFDKAQDNEMTADQRG